MTKIGRNDPCPCGSGKKFKKCHMGREEEMAQGGENPEVTVEMSASIAALPEVRYGRCVEMADALDVEKITGKKRGIKFVDLQAYTNLDILGSGYRKTKKAGGGGVFINLYKTLPVDPDHIYLAISPDINDSSLVHLLAHALDYLAGSKLMPGTLEPLAHELGIPVEHLEHPEEYGYWLEYLAKKFEVQLDAEDAIVAYLYRHRQLIKGEFIQAKNGFIMKSKSDSILRFLSAHGEEIDEMIRGRPGYIGERKQK
jgi:hypothetical protein